MAKRKQRKLPLPVTLRTTSAGRTTLSIEVERDGAKRRLSQHRILPTEPRSYADAEEAWAGYDRVVACEAQRIDHQTTMLGFYERWTDEDDPLWGTDMTGRGRDTYVIYRSRLRKLVERYPARPVASMTEAEIRTYIGEGGVKSALASIVTFFKDATTEGLYPKDAENPAGVLARTANKSANHRRRTEKRKRKPPQKSEVGAMLDRAARPCYPRSVYGWLLTGTETGMRGGELDGMQFEFLDGDVYDVRQQLHYRTGTLEDPKHKSFRRVVLPDAVLHEIEHSRATNGSGSPFIWRNIVGDPLRHDARNDWWEWNRDGGPSLRSVVSGATMYQSTRHHWAYHALNVLHLPVPQIAALYGHKDGGKTLLEYYADPDNDTAIEALRAARAAQPVDLSARRRAA